MALLDAVKAKQNNKQGLKFALEKLLCEDAVDKDLDIDEDKFIPLDDVLAEKTISAFKPTLE